MKPGDLFLVYQDIGPEQGCYHAYAIGPPYKTPPVPNHLTPVAFLGHTCSNTPRVVYSKHIKYYEKNHLLLWVQPEDK